jgi:S-adenosylmethionine synthetase
VQKGKIINVLVSTQHTKDVTQSEIREALIEKLIEPVLQRNGALEGKMAAAGIEFLVNPTGSFVIGGFDGDTGLTGRKIMVDTYGGLISHGGGCFSGKDPSKVDRSAAYFCRFVAKNLVHQGYAKEAVVTVAYAIGRAEPLMITAYDEKGKSIEASVLKKYDFRPAAIIERLDLLRPIYQKTAVYGHFSKPDLPWEQLL